MRHIGDHVLIGTDTGGQDLWDICVCNGGETPVDGPSCVGGPFRIHITQRIDKGKDAVLLVGELLLEITRLNAAKGHAGPVGKAQGKHGCGYVRPKGDEAGVPSDLHILFQELLCKCGPILIGRHEHINGLQLIFLGHLFCRCRIGSSAHDGGKSGSRTIHKFHTPLSHNGVVRRSEPDFAVIHVRVFHLRLIKIRVLHIPNCLCNLLGEEGRHTCIQQSPQIGKMAILLHMGG